MSANDPFELASITPGTLTYALVERIAEVDHEARRALVRATDHQTLLSRCLREWARQVRADRTVIDRMAGRLPEHQLVDQYAYRLPSTAITHLDAKRRDRLVAELVAQGWLAPAPLRGGARGYRISVGDVFGIAPRRSA